MRAALLKIILWLTVLTALFALGKPLFMAFEAPSMAGCLSAMVHGLGMDLSMAAYLTVIPALLTLAQVLGAGRWARVTERIYAVIVAAVIATVTVLDLELYGYWGFRLDATPVFYFTTSPSAALASATAADLLAGIAGTAATAALIWLVLHFTACRIRVGKSTPAAAIVTAAATAALFLPIRGGVTVSTMNPSRAYFSPQQHLNHAALNPLFNLLYSLTHQDNFASQYRFFSTDEAQSLCADLERQSTGHIPAIASDSLLRTPRPDICLVILESFSAHLMPSLGGADVATGLDSIARQGVLFSRMLASSFRTDRALPAILAGLPAQPSTSVMKYTDKAEHLPTIARSLRDKAGYRTEYYYGGDDNFTNMRAFLVAGGFGKTVSDRDFPLTDKLGKWGAPDHVLARRVLSDIAADTASTPVLRVVQTSSSHEPFEVPYANPRFASNPRLNAFAYTDSVVTAMIGEMARSPRWARTLVILVPDHWGVWPHPQPDPLMRHHIPMVLTGGALAARGTVSTVGSQADIAATLLGAMGIDHSEFPFSKDLLRPDTPHYGFFAETDLIGLVSDNGYALTDITSPAPALIGGDPRMMPQAAAYLQRLYDYLNQL